MASMAALVCTLFATIFSCYRELREQAAELMRPPAPKNGKRVRLERMTWIWSRLSFTWKATIRNLVRYKKRFFMTVFGISGCMALLLVGFGLKDSIFDIGKIQYHELSLYNGNVVLNEEASEEEQDAAVKKLDADKRVKSTAENLLTQVTISNGKEEKDVFLNVPKEEEHFSDFVVTVSYTHLGMKIAGMYDSMHGLVMSEQPNPACADYCQLLKKLYAGAVPLAASLILQYQKVLFHGEELQKRFHETFGAGEDWEKLPL